MSRDASRREGAFPHKYGCFGAGATSYPANVCGILSETADEEMSGPDSGRLWVAPISDIRFDSMGNSRCDDREDQRRDLVSLIRR